MNLWLVWLEAIFVVMLLLFCKILSGGRGCLLQMHCQAIYLIDSELTAEEWNGQTWYIHEDCRTRGKVTGSLHLLPSYDEYLLGYKDRTDVLPKEHYSKAFTNNGLFYPIVLHEGQVIGNWDKSVKKRGSLIEHSWFRWVIVSMKVRWIREKDKYIRFWR